MTPHTHEELVERVAWRFAMTSEDARDLIAYIAESTKDATEEMLAAFIDGDLVPDAYREDWRLMHARCGLWPKDKADASQG